MSNKIDVTKRWQNYGATSPEALAKEHELSGNVVLSTLGDKGDCEDNAFFCGPGTSGEGYLSDTVDIDDTLRELVKGSPFEAAFDIGLAENYHEIMEEELPEGTTIEQAYDYLKQKLLQFDNIDLV